MPAPKHSKAAIAKYPAPDRDHYHDGNEYAEACRLVSEARTEFDKPRLTTAQRLDAIGIDAICEMIEADMGYLTIAKAHNMGVASFDAWLNADAERSARARESRVKSARQCDDSALDALLAIPDDGTAAVVSRQRELASHFRWRAKTRNPRDYGDKTTLAGDAENPVAVSLKVTFGK